MLDINKLYNKVTELPYDQIMELSMFELDHVREECQSMCEWEFIKDPPHPTFQPYYLDRVQHLKMGQRTFLFKEFLEYYFTPFFLQTKCKIVIEKFDYGLVFSKRYLGCEHEFTTHYTVFIPSGPGRMSDRGVALEEIVCNKCGYKQS